MGGGGAARPASRKRTNGGAVPPSRKKLAFADVRKPRYCEAPSYVGNNSRPGRRFAARLPNTVVANINLILKKCEPAVRQDEGRSPGLAQERNEQSFSRASRHSSSPRELCAPEYGTNGARLGKYSGARLTSPTIPATLGMRTAWGFFL